MLFAFMCFIAFFAFSIRSCEGFHIIGSSICVLIIIKDDIVSSNFKEFRPVSCCHLLMKLLFLLQRSNEELSILPLQPWTTSRIHTNFVHALFIPLIHPRCRECDIYVLQFLKFPSCRYLHHQASDNEWMNCSCNRSMFIEENDTQGIILTKNSFLAFRSKSIQAACAIKRTPLQKVVGNTDKKVSCCFKENRQISLRDFSNR